MNPHEPHKPFLTRERSNALGDKLHEVADELQKLRFSIEDEEQNNQAMLRLCDAVEGHANAISALAHFMGVAWRLEK